MRLWSLDPIYLDTKGLVAVWREALLAQKVLQGQTKGYKNHPQLDRFKGHDKPLCAIGYYLAVIWEVANDRGYKFDLSKVEIEPYQIVHIPASIAVTQSQLDYEWRLYLSKLEQRNREWYERLKNITAPDPHPIFYVTPGPIEPWERVKEFA